MESVLFTLNSNEVKFIEKWLQKFYEDNESFIGQIDRYDSFQNRLKSIMIEEGLITLRKKDDAIGSKVDVTSIGIIILRNGGLENYISELKSHAKLEKDKLLSEIEFSKINIKNYKLTKILSILSLIISIIATVISLLQYL